MLPLKAPVINPQFHLLTVDQKDRLQYCRQLYSSTTNMSPDQFDLLVGTQHSSGITHYVLSLWDEPEVNEPLESHHLIGFCEV